MKLALIVAHAENLTIGKDGKLPWHYSEDLKRFKRLTMGHPVIMGRKTYESIGHPLPGRRNIVISRTYKFTGVEVFPSLEKAFKAVSKESVVFIIGGASLYRHSLKTADLLYATVVHEHVTGDVCFPEYRHLIGKTWKETNRQDFGDFSFLDYERVEPGSY